MASERNPCVRLLGPCLKPARHLSVFREVVDLEPMKGKWQQLLVDISDIDKKDRDAEIPADSDSDAEIMADGDSEVKIMADGFWRTGLCSEPPSVLVRRQKRKPDCHAKINLRFALFDALNAEAQKMKENNLKKLMIYYKGHGASTVQEYTVCPDAALVLEDQVVDAVEEHGLEYVCVMVPYLLGWSAFQSTRVATTTKPLPPKRLLGAKALFRFRTIWGVGSGRPSARVRCLWTPAELSGETRTTRSARHIPDPKLFPAKLTHISSSTSASSNVLCEIPVSCQRH